jgi:hypothetical protein
MAKKRRRYVLCVNNEGYAASLEARKIYVAIDDAAAKKRGMLRIIDESGDDYLFDSDRFVAIEVPEQARTAFAGAD